MKTEIKNENGLWLLNGRRYSETFGAERMLFDDHIRELKEQYVSKMNKKEQIQFWNDQLKTAQESKAAGRQIQEVATRLETAATSALAGLGVQPERSRKGIELPDSMKVSLLGSLTAEGKA